jgi:hypothetical protein
MEQTIAVIEKNAIEEVHIALSEYRDHDLVSVRIYANYASAEEVKRPTRKGVTLKVEKLPDLIAALQEAEQRARAAGLLTTKDEAA